MKDFFYKVKLKLSEIGSVIGAGFETIGAVIGRFFNKANTLLARLCVYVIEFLKNNPLYINAIFVAFLVQVVFIVLAINANIHAESYSLYGRIVDLIFITAIFVLIDLIKNTKAKLIAGTAFTSVFFLIVFADTSYKIVFGTLPSVTDISNIKWLFMQDVGATMAGLQVIIISIFAIYMFFYIRRVHLKFNKEDKRDRNLMYKVSLTSIIALLCTPVVTHIYLSFEDYEKSEDGISISELVSNNYLYDKMSDRTKFAKRFGYFTFRVKDISSLWRDIDQEETIAKLNQYFSDLEGNVHEENDYTGYFAGKNLITITAESLDTRLISKELTPNLYMFMNEGITFSNYYVPEYQTGATCNAEFVTITGLYPPVIENSNTCTSYSDRTYTFSLPRQLQEMDYETYYMHQGISMFYNRHNIVPNGYGFENSFFTRDDVSYLNSPYDTDMTQFLDDIEWNDTFYLNILSYSMHGGSTDSFDKYLEDVEATYPNLFKNGKSIDEYMTYHLAKSIEADLFIGELINRLDDEGELDNTVIIISPDHWPYEYKNGRFSGKDAYLSALVEYGFMDAADYTNVQDVHKQTLMIYDGSGDTEAVTYDNVVATTDLHKTILNLFDDKTGSIEYNYSFGNDMFLGEDTIPVFSDLTTYYKGVYYDISDKSVTLPKELEEGYTDIVNNGITMSYSILITNWFVEGEYKGKPDI